MSVAPRPRVDKHCFVPCPPELCDCKAGAPYDVPYDVPPTYIKPTRDWPFETPAPRPTPVPQEIDPFEEGRKVIVPGTGGQ